MKNKIKIIIFGLAILFVLLQVRLQFFLKDDSNHTIENIIIIIIFVGSWLLFFMLFLHPKKYSIQRWSPHIFYLIVGATILILDVIFIYKNGLSIDKTYFFSMFFILYLFAIIGQLFKKKGQTIFYSSILVIISIYLVAQDLYFRIFDDLFSFKEALTIREGIESSESMFQFNWYHVLIIVSVFIVFMIFRKLPKQDNHYQKSLFDKVSTSLVLLSLIFLNADYPVKEARLHTSDIYLYSSVYSRKLFAENFGSLNLFIRDLTKSLTPNLGSKKDIDYLDNYFSSMIDDHQSNDYTGLFEGMNLIYIVGESFDELVVNETLTPNLYMIKTQGWDFTNHYAPVYPRTTCDGEIIMNTSIIPSIEDGPTCYVYNNNSYHTSLANQLRSQDYLTQAFHNNYKEFYTRDLLYKGLGYHHFYGQDELGLSETDIRYDQVFFNKSKDLMIPTDEKFFSFILTLSGHSPYRSSNLASNKHKDLVISYYGDSISDELMYYISSQIELDLMLGDILFDLESKNLLDNTVIILTTDHYPYTLDQDIYESYKGINEDYQKAKAPLYIYTKHIEPMQIDKLSTSFDILPTILNLWNIDTDYRYYIGNDIFGSVPSYVYYKDYSVFTGETYFYLSSINPNVDEAIYLIAQSDYDISKRILRSDYFKKIQD